MGRPLISTPGDGGGDVVERRGLGDGGRDREGGRERGKEVGWGFGRGRENNIDESL
jgi:hypothetical protein